MKVLSHTLINKIISTHKYINNNLDRFLVAFEVLSDPKKKEIYDRFGPEGLKEQGMGGGPGGFGQQYTSMNFDDLLEQ